MRRRRWAIGAAVGALLIASGATLLGGGFVAGAHRAATASVAPFVMVDGRPVPYDRPQEWSSASTSSRAAQVLTVFATGSEDSGGGACGPPALRFRVRETAQTVAVLVADYAAPVGTATTCSLVGYTPVPHEVRLSRPLGSRSVVDAATGKPVTLLVGTDHPDLRHPPSGLRATALSQIEPGAPVTRSWFSPDAIDAPAISISDQSPASVRSQGPYGRVVQQTDVRDTPATVYRGVGSAPGTWFVQRTPNSRQTITVRVATAGVFRWDAASTLRLAREVTGYATTLPHRLGQPSVGGTVAATYNSADGPVEHAMNLLKSSGVLVGVDCSGAGRLTITIRDATTVLRCTAALQHHAFRSTGAAEATFGLSVHADPGVRWSLSLARASLDGS